MDSCYLGFSSVSWVDPVFLGLFLTCFGFSIGFR